MSTPMYEDLPVHMKIGVTIGGEGPVSEDEPDFHHFECWCGESYPCPIEPIPVEIFERLHRLVHMAIDRAESLDEAHTQVRNVFESKFGVY